VTSTTKEQFQIIFGRHGMMLEVDTFGLNQPIKEEEE
jgi:hypothetical protein